MTPTAFGRLTSPATLTKQRAVGIVSAIDQAYGLQVQRAVVEKLKQRAPGAGMSVVSERARG